MQSTIITEEIKAIVRKFADTPPEQIALKRDKQSEVPFAFIAQQIKGRSRIQKKLPSWHANEDVAFPKSLPLEQCSSEVAAMYKSELVEEGLVGVDLTGGFGVDARFFADKFSRFHYFEQDKDLAEIADWNFKCLGLGEKVKVGIGNGIELLDSVEGEIDFVFVDPARRDQRSMKVSAFEDCEPNLVEVWDALLAKARTVIVKASPGLDLSLGISQLRGVFEVHVLSVANECKELLFVARRGFEGKPCIHCVNILKSGERSVFSFSLDDEAKAKTVVGIPTKFLYEPNASIMKAGAFKTICGKYAVRALNPRTRLYCSNELIRDFPGKIFRINNIGSLTVGNAKRFFPKRKANVISRNSGMTAEDLRKKLKLKDGGSQFAIGATVSDVGRQLFACELVKVD